METITKSISVSPNLHRYILDHKDADHKSAEAVIYGLIGENDEYKKKSIIIGDDDLQEVFEILCEIPFETATMHDNEPPTKRHPAIEAIISHLQKRL